MLLLGLKKEYQRAMPYVEKTVFDLAEVRIPVILNASSSFSF